jgi:tRNA (cmo5U34)-methyltransferase
MTTDFSNKANNEQIKARFDIDVERFSNLETGQQTTMDAPLLMDLCTEAAAYTNPNAHELLDIGCGAGNYTLKMLSKVPNLNCTLNDLSRPMLKKAEERIAVCTSGSITLIEDDMRNIALADNFFDIVLAATTLHHLRDDDDWEHVFTKIYNALKPGGCFWISDYISHDSAVIFRLFRDKFKKHLESLGGVEYSERQMACVDYEDTPRSVNYQLTLLRKVGFVNVEILHKNASFAAFGGVKPLLGR